MAFATVREGRRVAIPGGALLLVVLAASVVIVVRSNTSAASRTEALATNPDLDPGTPVSGVAPDFTLSITSDSLSRCTRFRKGRDPGFDDSECTTVCFLTTTPMLDVRRSGQGGLQVALLRVDANPAAILLEDVG